MEKNYNEGFTIIEAVIAIAIIAILSFISFNYIQGEIQKSKIVSDIKSIYGLLQEGRKKAFAEKIDINFNLDISNKKACLIELPDNNVFICKTLNSDDYASTQNPIKIDKRGTFQKGTIYYTGNLKGLSYSCISVSFLRVKMGVWNGSECEVK